MHVRRWLVPIALAVGAVGAAGAAGAPAAAQNPEVQADGSVNVGYSRFTQSIFEADPNADPEDRPVNTSSRAFTEIRPGISVVSGRPRLNWRLAYQFSGIFSLEGSPLYSNQADAGLVALPSKHTTLTVTATGAQGGTSFILSQRPAEAGQPELRAPGSPNIVSASLAESFAWDAGRSFVLRQSLTGSLSSPQDQLDQPNLALAGSLTLERVFKRFSAGLEVRSSASRLRPLQANVLPYTTTTNGVLVRFNHDFSYRWNGVATAGVEQVFTDNDPTGSQPLAILPTGSVTALYTHGDTAAAVDLSHGSFTNIQVGTVSITDRITGRGIFTLDVQKLRTLSFSAGFLHNEPIGESAAIVAAGTGNVVQGDVAFTTAITKYILGTARYSLSYQFGQEGGLEPITSHIVLIGVTGRYSTTDKAQRQLPTRGRRVDGSDGRGFPAGGNPVEAPGGGAPEP